MMSISASFLVKNAQLLHPDGKLLPGHLAVEGEKILKLFAPDEPTPPLETIDGEGKILSPGFIDTHLQGLYDADVWDEGETGLVGMCRRAPQSGTTSFLATTEYHEKSLPIVMKGYEEARKNPEGARVLGLHLEGPFIHPEFCGALPPSTTLDPTPESLDRIFKDCQGQLKLMTIAPERPGHLELVRHLVKNGVVASLGHSGANYEEALAGIKAGIRHATHLFNAMTPMHHRRPGAPTAILSSPEVAAEIVCDTIHIHPAMIRLAHSIKGSSGLMLITDAVRVAGMPDGTYSSKGHGYTVIKREGAVRLEDGTLAGSCLTTDKALQNAVNACGIPVEDALIMLTRTPAEVLGITGKRGILEPGRFADLVLLNRNLQPEKVWIEGKLAYTRK